MPTRRRNAPRHPAVNSPAFKRWFGASKVVDAQGEPLVVYHGTTGNFEAFDSRYADTNAGTGVPAGAFFFTSSPAVAASYTATRGAYRRGASIMPVYLSLQRPLVVDLSKWGGAALWDDIPYRRRTWHLNDLVRHAQRRGYDGLVVRRVKDVHDFDALDGASSVADTYVAFSPTQVKSATGNAGTFDPNDPSILRNPSKVFYEVQGIHDTRFYERDGSGRWKAVPGSGEHRPCDICQHDHVVHVVLREMREPTQADLAERTPTEAAFMVRAGLKVPTGNTPVVGRDCAEQMTGQKISKTSWDAATAKAVTASRRSRR
jgi:hypothetical protein